MSKILNSKALIAITALSFIISSEAIAKDAKSKKPINNKKSLEQTASKNEVELPKVTVIAGIERDGNVDGYKSGSTISATKTETKLLNVPQSISVVTDEQIRDQNITSMEEAVRYIPGVDFQQGEANRDGVSIRGNSTTADFFVDGTRDDLQYFRDFYNTNRIEFLKGPNAMSFGRGGSGGVINRVMKFADGETRNQLILSGGSFDNRRVQSDVGGRVNNKVSLRLNTMYEKSGTFRKYGDLERFGFNPNATIELSKNTDLKFGYEYFKDKRFNDRGLPSRNGVAYVTDPSTFFGNPNENEAEVETNSVYAILNHKFSSTLNLKNHTRFSKNDKFYQNVYTSGSVGSTGNVSLSAYNDSTQRNNFTNQTDLTKKFDLGSTKHTALLGAEITRQDSSSFRQTGYFNGSSTSATVNVSSPLNFDSINYRQSSSDKDNKSEVNVFAAYAQDQIDVNKYLQLIGGLRLDRFEMNLENNRNAQNFKRIDTLLSPRLGVVVKPQESVSLYSSYSVSYLPSSGDQFSSLDEKTAILKPEKMQNYEIGAKWDVTPRINLATAIYQLDRTNTKATDPNGSGYYVLTGESRTRGFELSSTGKITDKWQVIAGYAFQDAKVVGATSAASKNSKAALVPHNKFSLWNKYDFTEKFAAGLGAISQSGQFAASDNTVKIKGFTRFDGALYYKINSTYKVQLNVENIFDRGYILTAHNNNNIQPGSPRAYKASLVADF